MNIIRIVLIQTAQPWTLIIRYWKLVILCVHSARNVNDLPGNVGCLVRSQKFREVGNFLRRAGPAQGNYGQHGFLGLLRQISRHVGLHKARGHGIHSDVA